LLGGQQNQNGVSEPVLRVGDRIRLTLESLAAGGEAVGRYQGMAVFALWGCPGDEAEVEITEVSKRFARGIVQEVTALSPDRIVAPCPHFGYCGGCQLQHIAYPAQLRHKRTIVRDALARIGGLPEVEIADTWGMDEPWQYRNRAEYHGQLDEQGSFYLGFARHHTHEVFPLQECRLQHPLSERVRRSVLDLMPRLAQGAEERAGLLEVETLVSFSSQHGLATLVCDGRPGFVTPLAERLMHEVEGLKGVLVARARGRLALRRSPSEVVVGEAHLVERLGEARYRISPDSFFQVNPSQAARMVELVRKWAEVRPRDGVLDLYSGVGTFLLPLARIAHHAVGVEADEAALVEARANLRRWRLTNVRLYEGKAENVLPRLAQRGWRSDVVVLDPPRKGCGPIVCAALAKLNPRRILLVSCHPATLARDLKSLAEHGYVVRRLQPIDMFPQTWHVEAIAICERGQ
jgi:23S rRNA (uracil1939-C5)-methyltransferase